MSVLAVETSGVVLRRTELGEPYVAGILAAVVLAAWVLVRVRASDRAVRNGLLALTGVWAAGLGALAAIDLGLYNRTCLENGLWEWASAAMLLAAAVGAAAAAVRAVRRGRAAPLALLLAAGFALACGRELEYGRPFFGEKVFYSRYLFHPRAWLDPTFIATRPQVAEHDLPVPPYAAHLAFSLTILAGAAALGAYLLRHRRAFAGELRAVPRTTSGRCFLLGLAAYAAAQGLGKWFRAAFVEAEGRPLLPYWKVHGWFGHRIVDEPLETWAAGCFLVSVVMLWRALRRAQDSLGRPARSG